MRTDSDFRLRFSPILRTGKYKMTDDKNNVTMFSNYGYVVSSLIPTATE